MPSPNPHNSAQVNVGDGEESDYGSDIDNDTWEKLTALSESQPLADVAIQSIEDPLMQRGALQTGVFLKGGARNGQRSVAIQPLRNGEQHRALATARGVRMSSPREATPDASSDLHTRQHSLEPNVNDTRTPLQRFRTPPKKPLSVTDIISPAWCELQYWYSLTKYGRTRRTPAMKQGSKIHKEKEREVYIEVPVETVSPEDRFGLRLWNMISGLRTLRNTGLTREMEVMGLIEGEVIIGVIDEITRSCPDEEMAASLLNVDEQNKQPRAEGTKTRRRKKSDPLPANQQTLPAMYQGTNSLDADMSWLGSLSVNSSVLYLVDIKTRKSPSLPSMPQMRPTRMQLMMYRQLLLSLGHEKVDAAKIFQRYELDPERPFSDTFVASMGALDSTAASEPDSSSSQEDQPADFLEEILAHNTLQKLWKLLTQEMQKTISTEESTVGISPMLTAEFRSSDTGDVIGKRCFAYDETELGKYTSEVMSWWTGRREARGVDVEEAYKCGFCEFAASCSWRAEKLKQDLTSKKTRAATVKTTAAAVG